MSNDELLDLVNEKDEVIGTVWKSEAHKDPTKIHREIAIAVFNDRGETLFQRRSLKKTLDPGMWQLTAAGHVGAGELPEVAAVREVEEEVGIDVKPVFVNKELIRNNNQSRFFYIYYSLVKGNPKAILQEDEVADSLWILPDEIKSFGVKNNYQIDPKSLRFVVEIAKTLKI